MAHIRRLYDFQAGTKIVSDQVDAEFNQLITKVNDLDTNKVDDSDFTTHEADQTNPHSVTKAQVGLSNVDNTSDLDKPVSTAQQAALNLKVDRVAGKALSKNDYTDADKALVNNAVLKDGSIAMDNLTVGARNTGSISCTYS